MLAAAYAKTVGDRIADAQPDSDKIGRVARWLTSETCKPSLLLYGGVGNGKTTMLWAIKAFALSVLNEVNARLIGTVQSIEERESLYAFRQSLRMPKMLSAQRLACYAMEDRLTFEEIAGYSFLMVDDMGCEPSSVKNYGTQLTPIADLIYRRYDAQLPTVITTNLSLRGIRDLYGERVADRMREQFEMLGYTEKSFRK